MATIQEDIVYPEELQYFVQSLRPFSVEEIGSKLWIDCHEMVIKLSQQATLEASTDREETVKEVFLEHAKLKVLVHEAFCILVWKLKVLPTLLSIEPNPPAGFLIYTALFHEGAVISLLEICLFHQNGCESLQEAAVDLVDYCAQAVTQLIGLVSMGYHESLTKIDVDESSLSEIERQKRDLLYKIGIRCLSILNYLVDSIDKIPLSAVKRMVTVHDIPCLLGEILHFKPWLRKTPRGFEKLIDDKWVIIRADQLAKVTKVEAQVWFCFRQLLFNSTAMESYEITDFKQRQLAKCIGLLSEALLDQLPPLADLKHFLCTLTPNTLSKKQSLVLELVPEIKEGLIQEAEKTGFYEIAAKQSKIFLTSDRKEIFNLAKRLNAAYNTDFLADFEEKLSIETEVKEPEEESDEDEEFKCANCNKGATKRCANCMQVYYCSRKCQFQDWPSHKETCIPPEPAD